MVRRVDRRTNALPTDRQTDGPTNRPTDRASYRGALLHLKKRFHRYATCSLFASIVVRLRLFNVSISGWYLWFS